MLRTPSGATLSITRVVQTPPFLMSVHPSSVTAHHALLVTKVPLYILKLPSNSVLCLCAVGGRISQQTVAGNDCCEDTT